MRKSSIFALLFSIVTLAVAIYSFRDALEKECDFLIGLPPVEPGQGTVVSIDRLLTCRRLSAEKFSQALAVLVARADWYSFSSDHPFHVWYEGRVISSERHENYITEANGAERTRVFYSLPMRDPIDEDFRGLRSIAFDTCPQDNYLYPYEGVMVIYPCPADN